MRAFIGIEFPREIKDRIIKIQEIIRNDSTSGRWKYIDNFHVTLKFLGEVSGEQTSTIKSCMEEKMRGIPGFTLSAGGVGYFEGQSSLRVIYLKVGDNGGELEKLFHITEDCSFASGIEREKRGFTPHITIAQDVVLKGTFDDIKERISALPEIVVHVKETSIIKSQQIDGRRVYTPVKTIKLMV